jgi:creatinine amidohydrolase
MTPTDADDRLGRHPCLIVPVGSTEEHGPHLPVGGDTLIVERLADDLSVRTGMVRAPTVEFGVNLTQMHPGTLTAGLQRKTLHRVMNELIESWEIGAGITEFLVLTAEGYEPHQEALSTIIVQQAEVKVVDIFGLDFGDLLEGPKGPEHGGELDTSLLLYIAPDLVKMDYAKDRAPSAKTKARYRRGGKAPHLSVPGEATGYPTLASAAKGAVLYTFILDRILDRVVQQTA